MIDSTETTTFPKSTKSRNLDSSVPRGTNSNRDVGLICTKKFEFLELVDFGGLAVQWNLLHPGKLQVSMLSIKFSHKYSLYMSGFPENRLQVSFPRE